MANLTEVVNYDAGIYQLETTDPVQGGPGGISNSQAKGLANRTGYLKKHIDDIESGATVPAGLAPINSPVFTGDPRAPTPVSGDNDTSIATTAWVQSTVNGLLSKNVAGGVNVTLTQAEAGVPILYFYGALTANIAVIVPTTTRNFVAINGTSGAFTLTVKTAAGTGVFVQQSRGRALYCDGGSIYLVNTDYTDIAMAGTPTAPTPAVGISTGQVATMQAVQDATDNYVGINVAGGASITLTQAQWGYGQILLYGALTANINIVFPTQGDKWTVMNRTTGGFTVTLKTAAGNGPATIAGDTVMVACDGANLTSPGVWGYIGGTIANQADLQSALSGKSNTGHTHAASDINSGIMAAARLGSGTANVTTFLRGDGTWGVPSSSAPAWGAITGTLSSQTDLQAALNTVATNATWGGISGSLVNQVDLQAALNGKAASGAVNTATWGNISGTLSAQTDLQNAFNTKAGLAANTFSATQTAPAFNATSSLRYKKDVATLGVSDALELLAGIDLVGYRLKADDSIHFGVIAEQLADGPLDFVVARNEAGQPEAVNYQPLFVLAARALQGVVERLDRVEAMLMPVR